MNKENTDKLFRKYAFLYRGRFDSIRGNLMGFGFECPDSWYDLIDTLSDLISRHADKTGSHVKAVQVKEKFGGLRFYVDDSDETIDAYIRFAEAMSYMIKYKRGNYIMSLDLAVFKKMSKEEREEYGKTLPEGNTYNENGEVLTFKNSYGRWYEDTYDKNGKILTHKNFHGYWYEYTRDKNGKELTYKTSNGVDIVYFFWGEEFALGYDKNTEKYKAGCQYLTYKECEEFYKEYKGGYEDSHNFIEAIREHQLKVHQKNKLKLKFNEMYANLCAFFNKAI